MSSKQQINFETIITLLREVADEKITNLSRRYEKQKSDTESVAKGLKVKHSKSQYLYTVVSISPRDIVLRTPEGKDVSVERDEFNKEYELA